MSKPTVLLVEDEVLIRTLLADVLIDEGYKVVEARNVLQAVAALGSHSAFDFLITDVDMPGSLSGLDLAAIVANTSPSTRIIVTSGRRFDPDLLRGGCFLPKPYSIDCVVELLDGRPATDNAAVGWAAAVCAMVAGTDGHKVGLGHTALPR